MSKKFSNTHLDNDTAIVSGGATAGIAASRMYNITSVAQPNLNNAKTSVLIGNVVGGSSAVNGRVFFRGTSDDYDMWAEVGGTGSAWNWAGVLPYFKKGRIVIFKELNLANYGLGSLLYSANCVSCSRFQHYL